MPKIASYVPGKRLALACNAVTDLELVLKGLGAEPPQATGGIGFPEAAAAALKDILASALRAAHEAGELFGALCFANVLVGPQGEVWLVGAGHNFPVPAIPEGCPGLVRDDASLFNGRFTRAGDMALLDAMIASLAMTGEAGTEVDLCEGPCSGAEALSSLLASGAAARAEAPCGPPHSIVLHDSELSRVRLGETELDLTRKGPIRRLLRALVEARVHRPGTPLSVRDLLACGWPGENPRGHTGRARVYVAISTLRKWGIEPMLHRREEGYLLDPTVEIQQPIVLKPCAREDGQIASEPRCGPLS